MARKELGALDPSQIQKMSEPFAVTIVKVNGNAKQPLLELPVNGSGPAGTGYSHDDVLKIQEYVAKNWGGGFYEAKAIDSRGATHEWSFYFDPRMFPEKMPQSVANIGTGIGQPAPQMHQFGSSLPTNWGGQQQYAQPQLQQYPLPSQQLSNGQQHSWSQQQQHQQQQRPDSMWGLPPWAISQHWGGARQQPSEHDRASEERIRTLEEAQRKAELDRKDAEHNAAIERQRMANEKALAELREEMRRMADSGQKRPADDEVAKLRAELEQSKRDQAAALADQRHREDMRILQDQLAATNNRIEQLLTRPQGPDPMIEILRESTRQQSESIKELARSSESQFTRAIQIAEMMSKKNEAGDQTVKNITDAFSGLLNTQRSVFESMMQLNPTKPDNPVIGMIGEAAGRVSEVAQEYFTTKRDAATAEAQAKRAESQAHTAQAQAQAQIAQAQAQVASAQAQVEYAKTVGGTRAPQPAAPNGNGTNGKVIPINSQPAQAAAQSQATQTTALSQATQTTAQGTPVNPAVPTGKFTEDQAFGKAKDAILRLRLGVENGSLDVKGAVDAVMKGVGYILTEVQAGNMEMPPVFTLFLDERYADLWDNLLPKAPPDFRLQCTQLLTELADAEADAPEETQPTPN